MSTIFFPLHVWDREFDSRLLLSIILAQEEGNEIVLGHEYNMLPLLGKSKCQYMFRAGQSENTYRSKWDQAIKSTGGRSILQDEEGINNIPLKMINASEKLKIELWAEKTVWSNSVDHNIFQLTTQIAWSPLHKEYLKYCIKNCNSKKLAETTIKEGSGIRFDILGRLGESLYRTEIDSLRTIFDKYILVLDNFAVDQAGGQGSGLIDPSDRMRQLGYSEVQIQNYISQLEKERTTESAARKNFANIIKLIAKDYPSFAIVVRPHPGLYPGFWKIELADEKNIFVIGKGNVQPWIYGSLLTIQSGCTTGIEALAAGTPTIDVSNIIGDRPEVIRNSLAAQGINKPNTIDEMRLLFKKLIPPNKSTRFGSQINNTMNLTANIPEFFSELIENNSENLRTRISEGLNIGNGAYVIGKSSGMSNLLNIISSSPNESPVINPGKYVSNHPPNMGKSRHVDITEIQKKASQFIAGLKALGMPIKTLRLKSLSSNLFLLTSGRSQ